MLSAVETQTNSIKLTTKKNHKMKKKFLLCLLPILFFSCKTAVHLPSVEKINASFGQENMEFIGFKNVERTHFLIKDFGVELERRHIAVNRQNFYMGVYSLQELEVYKPTMRYISFIDVEKLEYTHDDNVSYRPGLSLGGWMVAAFTCFTLFPVYIPMICAASPNETELTLNAEMKLYVYDTQKKEIVLTIPMSLEDSRIYEGQYMHKDTDMAGINDHYRTKLYNLLLVNFSKAYDFVKNINE